MKGFNKLIIPFATLFLLVSCGDKGGNDFSKDSDLVKIPKSAGCGSAFIIDQKTDLTFYSKTDQKTFKYFINSPEYYYDKDGNYQFEIYDESNTVLMYTMNMSKKSEKYSEEIHVIDLDEKFSENYQYIITKDTNYVNITGEEDKEYHNVSFIIEPGRTTPVDVTFNNVTIKNGANYPIFTNLDDHDVNIICEGFNYLESADQYSYYDYKNMSPNRLTPEQKALKNFQTIFNSFKVDFQKELQEQQLKGTYAYMNDNFNEYVDWADEFTDGIVNGFEDIMLGKDGHEGIDASSVIMSIGGINIYGNGILNVVPGDGGEGESVYSILPNDHKGGKGGKGGTSISAPVISISLEHFSLNSGKGGDGGQNGREGYALIGKDGARYDTTQYVSLTEQVYL